jgi:hypothetical protein
VTGTTLLALTVLPESVLHAGWYAVLGGFVAVNTILYVTLSICKILPKVYLSDFVKPRGRRAETRSIYPNGFCPPDDYAPAPGTLAAMVLPTARTGIVELDDLEQATPDPAGR